MIRVTVELVPKGIEERKRTLGVLEIANDTTGNQEIGNYNAVLHAEYTDRNSRHGRVENFHRSTQSVWSLVGAFLKLFGHTKHSPKDMSLQVEHDDKWICPTCKQITESAYQDCDDCVNFQNSLDQL
ncbi:MAG: hypothetical protein U0930_05080 [Pirellulales bacterium]